MSNIYTLQIGINTYHPDSKVSALSGCENDVKGLSAFLEKNYSSEQLFPKTLINEEATYESIIRAFGEDHLLRANKGDVVLIQFSGHGARELAAPEFKAYAPEGKQETWVCYDSRLPGKYDLADKELSVLIARVAAKGTTVVVLMDSCHSGSGTRAIDFQLGKARQWDDRDIVRPLASYLDGHFVNNVLVPESKHILLAACKKQEKAFELLTSQGNFTTHLLKVLNEQNGQPISYAQLFEQCKIGMRKISDDQTPQLEANGFFNAHADFLDSNSSGEKATYSCYYEDESWVVNIGAIKGLPVSPEDKAKFEIYKKDTFIGNAESLSVHPDTCTIKPAVELNPGEIYQAKLISLPSAPIFVYCQTDEKGEIALKKALTKYKPVFFKLLNSTSSALYELKVEKEEIKILRQSDGLLIRTCLGLGDGSFKDVFETLEHICSWEKTLMLENKKELNRRDVELVLFELDDARNVLRKTSDPEVIIDILLQDGKEQKVPFRLEVCNHADKAYHCAVFYLSSTYATHRIYNEEVPPNSSAILMEYNSKGKPYSFELNGKNEATDIFKLIASIQKINDTLLVQKSIKIGERKSPARGIGFEEEEGFEQEAYNEWFTVTLKCKAVAQQAKVGDKDISLSNGAIKILSNESGFAANLALESATPTGRGTDGAELINKLLLNSEASILPLSSSSTRNASVPNTLVLQDIQGEEQLKENPLQIELATALAEDEELLSITFDGDHILPVGEVSAIDGKAVISIDAIPDIQDKRRRSVGKALKLCFLKLALKQKNVQYLRWVDYSQSEIKRKSEGIVTKVSNANRILILVHGIIGDTKGMAECMRRAHDDKSFDLILTFDYENLNTPIQDTANAFDEKLKEAGIDKESGKKVTIIAHSMGGLVSRYFIEKLGGNEVIQHLIMAGTPNAGSAFAKITQYRGYAMTLLGFLINSPWAIPAAAAFLTFLKQTKKVTLTLEQMDYDNGKFLKPLNKSSNPGIPYSIVAGHLDQHLSKNKEAKKLMDKLFKLGGKLLYGEESNDIAVSINSILSIPDAWEPEKRDVACHHMNYFDNGESVGVLYGLMEKDGL